MQQLHTAGVSVHAASVQHHFPVGTTASAAPACSWCCLQEAPFHKCLHCCSDHIVHDRRGDSTPAH